MSCFSGCGIRPDGCVGTNRVRILRKEHTARSVQRVFQIQPAERLQDRLPSRLQIIASRSQTEYEIALQPAALKQRMPPYEELRSAAVCSAVERCGNDGDDAR